MHILPFKVCLVVCSTCFLLSFFVFFHLGCVQHSIWYGASASSIDGKAASDKTFSWPTTHQRKKTPTNQKNHPPTKKHPPNQKKHKPKKTQTKPEKTPTNQQNKNKNTHQQKKHPPTKNIIIKSTHQTPTSWATTNHPPDQHYEGKLRLSTLVKGSGKIINKN